MDIEMIAAALGKYHRKSDGGFMAQCPAHDDRNPSFSIDIGENGKPVFKCFAGCSQESIIDSLKARGLWDTLTRPEKVQHRANMGAGCKPEWKPVLPVPVDAPEPPLTHPKYGQPSMIWRYRSEDGDLLHLVARFDLPGGKAVLPLTYGSDGGSPSWKWKALADPRPLYGLETLGDSDEILLVEGEKACDAARRLLPDAVVLTWSGGSCTVDKSDWRPLKGKRVIIWPDADEPGQKAAAKILKQLVKVGAKEVRMVSVSPDWPNGWDLADAEAEGWTTGRVKGRLQVAGLMPIDEPVEAPEDDQTEVFNLDAFAINDDIQTMEAQMLEDKHILGRMALLGQSTVFYAAPNTGKTLLTLFLLTEAIKRGDISGEDVYYVNADDTHKGLVFKGKLASDYGFKMLAPGYRGFKADALPGYLKQMIETDSAKGKVLILDTVKKFTDLMRKDRASVFGEYVRQLVSHGGTVIMLAHTNKHRDEGGKVVYSGTSDLVDDADCAYTIDSLTDDGETRVIRFENFKNRGDVAREAVYRYDCAEDTPYKARLDSVAEVGKDEREAAERQKRLDSIMEKNRPAIEAIKDCIRDGVTQKTALIQEAHERSGLSKKQITTALLDHTGAKTSENQFWHLRIEDKNAHRFELNYGVF